MYPLLFKPIYKAKPWGGRKLANLLNKILPSDTPIGESWEISMRSDGNSCLRDNDMTLRDMCKQYKERLLGDYVYNRFGDKFPLLIKFLDANEILSVQVHPSDYNAASLQEEDNGKTELWYILHSEPKANIVYGLEEASTPQLLREAVLKGKFEKYLHKVNVNPDDVFLISPGKIHTIGAGVVLVEIQQNSDLTYRLYDWGRLGLDGKPRPLHLEKALNVIDYRPTRQEKIYPLILEDNINKKSLLGLCEYFAVEKWELSEELQNETSKQTFSILICIEGKGQIIYKNNEKNDYKCGDTILLPAYLGSYTISIIEKSNFIYTYVPNLAEMVSSLLDKGFDKKYLQQLAGDGLHNSLINFLE